MSDRTSGPVRRAAVFRYEGHDLDLATGELRCRYGLDHLHFEERIQLAPATGDVDVDAVRAAARLVHLLAGVSYYKAGAPPLVDLGDLVLTPLELELLRAHHLDGLGEFAHRNGLDLSDLVFRADTVPAPPARPPSPPARPLIPFGGGIDSIVTVEGVRGSSPDAALFVLSRRGDRFDAIEAPAAVTGLPVVRAERQLDDQILRSRELGFLNGHVPVTGILSAIAVTAALLDGRDAVVMSNEHSASDPTLVVDGREVNHQWSKSLAFEDAFRAVLATSVPAPMDYHSWLRPFSELWVAQRLAQLPAYLDTFRSCNRSFHLDREQRLDHWCGQCDKCCFIDLILSPFLPAERLAGIFGGREPLEDAGLVPRFRSLLGTSDDDKPFECVGDVDECRTAVRLASLREDRASSPVLQDLAAEVATFSLDDPLTDRDRLLRPLGPHRIPDVHAPPDLLG